jgi:hypothetical protein
MRTSIITAIAIAFLAIPGTAHNSGVDYCKQNPRACLYDAHSDAVEQLKRFLNPNSAHDINPNNFQSGNDPIAQQP